MNYLRSMGQAARSYAGHYTVSEWERWQDQWELIDGVPYCMSPAPSSLHQRISVQIVTELQIEFRKRNCGKCKVYIPIDWQISDDTVVQPDVLIVCKPITGIRLMEPPAVVFEILSPSTRQKDQTSKFHLYQEQKVAYYIMVDPETETYEVYELDSSGHYQRQEFDHIFTFRLDGCEVELDFRLIWD